MVKGQYILPLVVTVLIIMHAPMNALSAEPDTVSVNSAGKNNRVIINSQELEASFSGRVEAPVQGEITQEGENNSVEINSGRGCSGKGTQKESHDLQDLKACSDSNKTITEKNIRQYIKVTQTGKNNSIKINSR